MKFNYIALVLVLLISCGKPDQPISTDYSPYKTESSLLACKSLRFPGDLKLNGNLLYNIPKCLSNKTESGEETLAGTVSMIETLGLEGLDSLTDLLKSNPAGKENEYPLIRSFLTITERGVVQEGVISEKLLAERFGFFQEYSSKLNPYFLVTLLVEMAENGGAKNLLDLLFPLVDEIEISNLMALNRALLVDEKFQNAALSLVNGILDNPNIYDPLKKIVTLEDSYPLPNQLQEDCLTEWLDPLPRGEKGECLSDIDLRDFADVPSVENIDKLKDGRIRKLGKMVSQVSKAFLTLESEDRLAALNRLSTGGKQALNTQDGFVRNMVALVDFFVGEEGQDSKVKISDLDFIMNGLYESIMQTGPDAVKALNQKVAAARLHYLAEQKILNGGEFLSCNNLRLPAMRDFETSSRVEVLQGLASYFLPYEGCPYGLSPIATFYFVSITKEIEIDTNCQGIDGKLYPDSCLDENHLKSVAQDLKDFDYGGWKKFEAPNSKKLKEIVLEVLTETKNELKKDPYSLHWPHFAEGKIPVKVINHIISKVIALGELSAEKIALLDIELEQDPVTKNILRNNFIENLLTKKIDDLKVFADTFSGIFKGDKVANKKAINIFSGGYFNGPLESFISSSLFTQKMNAEVVNFFTEDKFRVEELIGRVRMKGVFLNNSLLFSDDMPFNFKFLGEKKRAVSFLYKKNQAGNYAFAEVGFIKTPIQSTNLFSDSYLRFNKLLLEDTLMGVNLKNSRGDDFDYWAKNILFEDIKRYSYWEKSFKTHKNIKKENYHFFEQTPYSIDQTRKIALFYSKHFLMADMINFESGVDFDVFRKKRFAPINTNYLKLTDPNKEEWNYFQKLYPSYLKGEGRIQTFGELNQHIMNWNLADYRRIPWGELPSDKRRKRKFALNDFGPLGVKVVKTYNTLNLFTTNRKLKYMPLFGIGNECTLANGRTSKCPLSFKDISIGDGVGFQNLKQSVSNSLLSKLCPYLDESTSKFSPEFLNLSDKSLKIKIIDPKFEKICQNTKNLFDGLNDNIPYWYHEKVLTDLFELGSNPKLKKGLSQLGASIKYYKLKLRYKSSPKLMARELINGKGFLPQKYLKYYIRQTRDHRGFLTVFPGAINTYLNYLFNLSLGFGPQIDDVLARYGAGIKVDEDLKQGIVQDFLVNNLIKKQKEFKDREAGAIELIFKVLQDVDEAQINSLTGLLAYPQDIESLTSFTGTYSIFLRFLMDQVPPGEFWQRPGSVALKQLMRQENLRALTDIIGKFDVDEINRALKVLQKSILNLGEPRESVAVIRIISDFLKGEFLSINKVNGRGNVFIFEDNLRALYEEIYFNLSNEDLNKVFDMVVKDGLIDFKGDEAKSVLEDFDFLNYFTLKNTFKLLDVYQNHFKNRPKIKESDDEFFHNLVKSLLKPFKMPGAILGSTILANILEDVRIGTWEGLLKPLLFEEKYQTNFLDVLGRFKRIKLKDLDKGLVESNVLIPATHHSLKFLKNNMIWRPDASEDIKYSVDSFFRLSLPDGLLWKGNYSLLRNWLTQAKKVK